MANFATIREAIDICAKAGITLYISGVHGLGKSTLVNQYCTDHKWGCIDMRLSQKDVTDITGLPKEDLDNMRTIHLPPAQLPVGDLTADEIEAKIQAAPPRKRRQLRELLQPHYEFGILFLDEVNRCADDVAQSVFHLILDRKIELYVLPDGWKKV
jgi:MoxR-like ATPase